MPDTGEEAGDADGPQLADGRGRPHWQITPTGGTGFVQGQQRLAVMTRLWPRWVQAGQVTYCHRGGVCPGR